MAAAAEKLPWKKRKDVAFWRGGHTNVQRLVLAGSKVIKGSGRADIQLMSWEDDQRGDAFNTKFASLAEHCRYRCIGLLQFRIQKFSPVHTLSPKVPRTFP